MFTATSQTASEGYKAENVPRFERRYHLTTGNTGEMTISDPLLDTDAAAEQRARSEFLKNGYSLSEVSFKTHLGDFSVNQLIEVGGKRYLVKDITVSQGSVVQETSIRAVRYD